ncbi:MAG: ParB/RepB/Spo0J family partition protein [Treponema sp.]|nr:ParB/RepB/Spo0J family partition protein [Candidatus Treponema merdequi]
MAEIPEDDVIEAAPKVSEKKSASVKIKTPVPQELPDGIKADDNGTLWIDPKKLKPNPHQPRQTFSEEALNELADSIREHGVLQPITIEDAGDGMFYIIAGERRTRASLIAGITKVPVQLRKYSEEKKLEIALIENIQRADLNAIEEAQAYYKLMELSGLTQDEVAGRVGKQRSTVANALRLLKLPEDMQNSLMTGQITAGHARAILSVENAANQRTLFGKIVGETLSVRKAEELAKSLNEGRVQKKEKPTDAKKDDRDPDVISIEQQFINALGTKVTLKGNLNTGSVVIDFFSRSDLDRIYDILTK